MRRRSLAVIALLIVALGLAAAVARRHAERPPNHLVPYQYVARIATGALGLPPDPDTWRDAADFFHDHGCTAKSLGQWGRSVYLGDAYAARGYDDVDRTLTLYAGALAREPDADGMATMAAQAHAGMSWEKRVGDVFSSAEFTLLASAICSSTSPAYGAALPVAPIDVPPATAGFTGDEAALQAQLDATPPGGTVALAQRAVVRIATPLRIPPHVTLTTTGDPGPDRYARMGRLVRELAPADGSQAALVTLGAGASLRNVWADGGRAWLQSFVQPAITVSVGGDGATVQDDRVTDSLGGGSIFVLGPHYQVPCTTATVRGNLVTAYESGHDDHTWTDGISVACAQATVADNAVIDPTDVGIILYRVEGGNQAGTVVGNTVIAAGRSAFAALAADPLFGSGGQTFPFRGASFRGNRLWTGDRTRFDIGLAAGTRPWFGAAADKGIGVAFVGNTSASLPVRSADAIAVSGMLDATVQGNHLAVTVTQGDGCPPHRTAASLSDGWASGRIQGAIADVPLDGCIDRRG